jgi:hypothetical protein
MLTYSQLLARYREKHGALIKPTQGWDSLADDLWLAYSMGRVRGFTDLGTYNPGSRLPSGAKGDHAYYPAWAFDLGRKDRFLLKGWDYLVAQSLAKLYVENYRALNIEYVILGTKIWSRAKPYWHPYTGDSSHQWHMHVSGHH